MNFTQLSGKYRIRPDFFKLLFFYVMRLYRKYDSELAKTGFPVLSWKVFGTWNTLSAKFRSKNSFQMDLHHTSTASTPEWKQAVWQISKKHAS